MCLSCLGGAGVPCPPPLCVFWDVVSFPLLCLCCLLGGHVVCCGRRDGVGWGWGWCGVFVYEGCSMLFTWIGLGPPCPPIAVSAHLFCVQGPAILWCTGGWPAPLKTGNTNQKKRNLNRKEVCRFIGLINYYRGSHTLQAAPKLTSESVKFRWTSIKKYMFNEIKQ